MQRRRFLLGLAAAAGLESPLAGCGKSARTINFADVTRIWWNPDPAIAETQGYFQAHNVAIRRFEVATGRESLDAVISGNADIGMAAGSPLLFAALAGRTARVKVTAAVSQSSGLVRIVSRAPGQNGLPPGPVGYVKNTVSEYQLRRLFHGMPASADVVAAQPAELTPLLLNSSIASFICWEPYPSIALRNAKQTGLAVDIIPQEVPYQLVFYVFAGRAALQAKPAEIDRFHRALSQAAGWLAADRARAIAAVAQSIGVEPALFSDLWPEVDYRVQRDTAVLKKDLAAEASTAVEVGVTPSRVDLETLAD